MNTRLTLLFVITLVALMISACQPTVSTGSEQTFHVDVPPSEVKVPAEIGLHLASSAGTVALDGGAENPIQGTITYNAVEYEPQMNHTEDGAFLISQKGPRGLFLKGNPDLINNWELKISDAPIVIAIDLDTGNYTVKFSKALPSNVNVTLKASVGNVDLVFAPGLNAQILLGKRTDLKVKALGTWMQSGDTYTLGTSSATITIKVNMTVGNLTLDSQSAE